MKALSTTVLALLALGLLISPFDSRAHEAAVSDMANAARLFITSLSDEQKAEAVFEWKSDKREGWHFVPDRFIEGVRMRYGLPIKKMTPRQRILAQALVSSGLSNKGYLQASTIRTLEQILHELENKNPIRDPELYYVSIFGTPSEHSTWSWRFEGHHLSLNFTIIEGHHFSVTPSFFGTNPGRVKDGDFKDLQVLKPEEDLARALVKSFSPKQRQLAVIDAKAPADIITGQERKANKGLFLPVKGIPFAKLDRDQKKMLLRLTEEYAVKYRRDILDEINARTEIVSGKGMHFAWAGGTEPGEGHYYRIQTDRWLFEYDNTQNGANHIHAVWRDFDGDFGADLLREHYDQDHKSAP